MKKRFIGLTFFLISILAFCQKANPELTKYVDFLEKQNVSAKDYVLGLFKKYDIVVLCERHHGEMTQYDLIYEIVSSPYFQKNVGNIFTEVGAVDNRENVLKFINTNFENENEKTKQQLSVYRNMTFGIWEKTNFYNFLGKLNSLNSTLSENRKINLFVSNSRNPNSEETNSIENYKKYFDVNWRYDREKIMAQNVITTFDSLKLNSQRKKALVIMNYRHAFSKSLSDDGNINVGDYLKRKYGNRFANVLINSTCPTVTVENDEKDKPKIFRNMSETLIQEGKWDASFKVAEKENLGFDFNNSPFGKDYFDFFSYVKHNYNYQDIFNGFIFYLPIEKHYDSYGIKDIANGHEDEIYQKDSLLMKSLGKEPNPKSNITELNKIEIEKYDDLDKLILMREQWLKQ